MHSSALLRLVVGSSALIVGVQAQQSSELPIPSSVAPSSVAPSVIVSGQPSLRDAGFLPLLIALGALPVGLAVLM
ncbi:V-type proton ATPase subunit d [Verticillium dahliae VDG1]|nr:V-type proton ATPase subunit d [Verticillium dahliae VDG1]